MVDLTYTLGDLANSIIIIGAAVGVAAWLYYRSKRHERYHVANSALLALLVEEAAERNPSFKDRIRGFDALLNAWERKHVEATNPITAQEATARQALSARLREGKTLTNAELVELNRILQKELDDARKSDAGIAVLIAIIILIGIVAVALAASRS